ncbi:MAG: FimB/Mfa2 family fimbrial subunit [Porphyromonas sp.]|nr:FimB/Mfa2 family fimbrial subunit [Porphyromonas sp.]
MYPSNRYTTGIKAIFNRTLPIWLSAVLAVGLLSGCHRSVYDDLTECPQGINFAFDILHPDGVEYSEAVKSIRLFVFDAQGRLITEVSDPAVEAFVPDYRMQSDLYRPGETLTFVAWAGADLASYDFEGFTVGTSIREMTLSLAKQAGQIKAEAAPLFVSHHRVTLTQAERIGTYYDPVQIDLVQLTNHIDLIVEGFAEGVQPAIRFRAQNSRYGADGALLPDTPFEYIHSFVETAEGKRGGAIHAVFDILKLDPELDYPIEIYDEVTGDTLYSFDLLKDYILYNGPFAQGDRGYTLERNHKFDILIRLQKGADDLSGDTYVAVMARILGWNIVFRHTSLG